MSLSDTEVISSRSLISKRQRALGTRLKQLIQASDVITAPLTIIWNNEIIKNKRFPSNLKLN